MVQKKQKIDFQDGHGGHLGFPIGTILAIFDVQVTLMLLTEFHVNWPFGSGEEANKSTTSIIPRNSNHLCFKVIVAKMSGRKNDGEPDNNPKPDLDNINGMDG